MMAVTTVAPPPARGDTRRPARSILLVEDSRAEASLIRAVLAETGSFAVTWAATLDEARVELAAVTFACVVVDLGLPDADGLEALDAAREAAPGTPVVVLTGRDDRALALDAMHRGAEDYLFKSELGTRLLERAVTYAIERAEARSALRDSEAHHRAVVGSLAEGVVLVAASGEIQVANEAACRILGLTREELLERKPTDPRWGAVREDGSLLSPDDHPSVVALRTGQPVSGVIAGVSRADGTVAWIEINSEPLATPGRPPYATVTSFREITERRQAEESIRFQAKLLDAVGQAVIATDPAGDIIYWNRAAERLYGWRATEVLGRCILDVTPSPDHAGRAVEIFARLSVGDSWSGDFTLQRRDGTMFPALVTDTPVLDENGDLVAIIGVSTDISERKATEEAVRQLSWIVESSGDAIFGTALDGTIRTWNAAAERLYGYGATEVVGRHVTVLAPDDRDDEVLAVLARVTSGDCVEHLETRRRRRDGSLVDVSLTVSPVYDERGRLSGTSAIVRDITDRKRMERELEHQALHDALTGLPNRFLLNDRLACSLERRRRQGGSVAVLFCDLDGFKFVNDAYGHVTGDRLLADVAARLRHAVRYDDTVARFGGDEFVIVCEVPDAATALATAERVREAFSLPFVLDGVDLYATASIGVAFAEEGSDGESLLRDADTALYRAKERGRARVELFEQSLRDRAAARLEVAASLHRAVESDALEVHYQPVIDLRSGAVTGCEALVRWQHPERGLVLPAEFIPLAEETGLIVPIGDAVLTRTLGDLAWLRSHCRAPHLVASVNVSAHQLADPAFADRVAAILEATSADPAALALEITESVLMADVEKSVQTLGELRTLGVRVQVDDFGTGYSSLAYLRQLPIETLKIDMRFIEALGTGHNERVIVTAVIAMAHALGMPVVAEGVQTLAQLHELQALECDAGQGFLWSPPLPREAFCEWADRYAAAGASRAGGRPLGATRRRAVPAP